MEIDNQKMKLIDFEESNDSYRRQIEVKFDQANIEDMLRVTHNQLKQNFQCLEEILQMQWRQIDDVRKGMRNVITYQKFIHPLSTQQIISENFLHLAEASGDEAFVEF
jgi:hypothetical protein